MIKFLNLLLILMLVGCGDSAGTNNDNSSDTVTNHEIDVNSYNGNLKNGTFYSTTDKSVTYQFTLIEPSKLVVSKNDDSSLSVYDKNMNFIGSNDVDLGSGEYVAVLEFYTRHSQYDRYINVISPGLTGFKDFSEIDNRTYESEKDISMTYQFALTEPSKIVASKNDDSSLSVYDKEMNFIGSNDVDLSAGEYIVVLRFYTRFSQYDRYINIISPSLSSFNDFAELTNKTYESEKDISMTYQFALTESSKIVASKNDDSSLSVYDKEMNFIGSNDVSLDAGEYIAVLRLYTRFSQYDRYISLNGL